MDEPPKYDQKVVEPEGLCKTLYALGPQSTDQSRLLDPDDLLGLGLGHPDHIYRTGEGINPRECERDASVMVMILRNTGIQPTNSTEKKKLLKIF